MVDTCCRVCRVFFSSFRACFSSEEQGTIASAIFPLDHLVLSGQEAYLPHHFFLSFLRLASILIICRKDAGESFKNLSPRLKKVLTMTIFRTWPAAWEVGNNWPNGVSPVSA